MSFKTLGVLVNGGKTGGTPDAGMNQNQNQNCLYNSSLNSNSNSNSQSRTNFDKNFDALLILERSLERSGQQWVENLNVIEQHLVDIVESIGQEQPLLKSNFILRRLPMYTTSFTNKNEYAVVLNNIPFTLLSPRRHSTIEKNGPPNFGQIELFHHQRSSSTTQNQAKSETEDSQNIWSQVLNENKAFCSHEIFKKFASSFIRIANKDLNDSSSEDSESEPENDNDKEERVCSKNTSENGHEDDKKKKQRQKKKTEGEIKEPKEKVQLIGPHLLYDLQTNRDVPKIFTLTPTVPIPTPLSLSSKKGKDGPESTNKPKAQCRISINYLKSFLLISYNDTEVIVRPCLFHDRGYSRVNTNILERLPLFHTNILNICDGLSKGLLFFPTSFETLWTLGFWPIESHILCVYHPSSLISRLFKLYSAFCLHPANFWESLNNCFLIGMDDLHLNLNLTVNMMESLESTTTSHSSSSMTMYSGGGNKASRNPYGQGLNVDFLWSSFLFELEKFSGIEDWAPRNFYRRFISLIATSVDSYEKGFHAHYFTKVNILRGIWKEGHDQLGHDLDRNIQLEMDLDAEFGKEEESSVLKELDDIEEFPEDYSESTTTMDHGSTVIEKSTDYLDNDDNEDYGLHFDSLETTDMDESEVFSSLHRHHHHHRHQILHDRERHSSSSSGFNNKLGNTPLTSDMVYRTVNPFSSVDNLHKDELYPPYSSSSSGGGKKSKTLSKMFGSNLLKRFSQLGRSQSDADAHAHLPGSNSRHQESDAWRGGRRNSSYNNNNDGHGHGQSQSQSMADVTSGFEESVAQHRREQSLNRHLMRAGRSGASSNKNTNGNVETSFSVLSGSVSSRGSKTRGRSYSVPSTETLLDALGKQGQNNQNQQSRQNQQCESIYTNILAVLKDIPPSDHLSDTEVVEELERSRRVLESQDELVVEWTNIMNELPPPKTVCPHTFSPRQIQYISLVIQKTSQCSASAVKLNSSGSSSAAQREKAHVHIPAWEISGDLLRTVLHQMRSEPALCDSFKEKRQEHHAKPIKRLSLKSFKMTISGDKRTVLVGEGPSSDDQAEGQGHEQLTANAPTSRSSSPLSTLKKLSFKRRHSDTCTGHLNPQGMAGGQGIDNSSTGEVDIAGETQFAMEEPETAATNRLLQWLWQLRSSDIGRLSSKAKRYLELLHRSSFQNSHFLEQFSEEKIFQSMAIRSAVAVSRIMADEKFPAYVPLLAASKKGWLWSEMILSLASWNKEKGFPILADVPISPISIVGGGTDQEGEEQNGDSSVKVKANGAQSQNQKKSVLRDIYMSGVSIGNTLKKIKNSEPDAEAVTLAFHSELATPLGWNDFEDPRRPGPFTVPILIFSSLGYFNQWEMSPGNIVQVMVRLQKFNNLQHVGALLFPPHRKTALNEVRKLNKSLSFRTFQFDDNVMSKTFKRLASLRSTRKLFSGVHTFGGSGRRKATPRRLHTCMEIGCANDEHDGEGNTKTSFFHGKEFECTRL